METRPALVRIGYARIDDKHRRADERRRRAAYEVRAQGAGAGLDRPGRLASVLRRTWRTVASRGSAAG
jgi:hypothetical protein